MLLLTKAVFAIMIGFLFSVVLGLVLLPLLRKLKVGQRISSYVGYSHRQKEGTPTMGGLIFIIPTIIITLGLLITDKIPYSDLLITDKIPYSDNIAIVLVVFLGFAIIGFLDDFLSLKKHNNEGLTTYQKLLGQVIISTIFFYIYMKNGGQTSFVVGTLGIDIELTWLYGLFILFILIGASNAVNLTDGLDGLAGSLSAVAFIAFALISFVVGFEDIGIFCLVLVGSLIGFLVYNTHPAKVFMGDTGSLALGGVMGAVAILTHRELTLLVVAGVFVIETLSVILQVFWLRFFHKKLFLMTPLHHHFEKLGWQETDIVKLFVVFGLLLAMGGIIFGVWL